MTQPIPRPRGRPKGTRNATYKAPMVNLNIRLPREDRDALRLLIVGLPVRR